MKHRSEGAIQYSGYPLSIAELKPKEKGAPLMLVKVEMYISTTFIQKSRITNDPKHWDVNWFGGYE